MHRMSNRRERLRKAEKLLRQGRLDAAIGEYVTLVEEEPRDWATTNALGDLYVRAKQVDNAVGQYARIADHFWKEGFFPKAAAVYKKIVKVKPTDEPSQMRIGDISAQQGKLVDAKAAYHTIIQLRRTRGDAKGANKVVARLGEIDPNDYSARRAGAQAHVELGQIHEAIESLGQLASDLNEIGRTDDAVAAIKAVVTLDPTNTASRAMLARVYLATGNLDAAGEYLTLDVAGDDPAMLLAVAEFKLRSGDTEEGREVVRRVVSLSPDALRQVLALASSLSDGQPDAAFVCVDVLADIAIATEDWEGAGAMLQEFVVRVPRHVGALAKLVEVYVDGGIDDALVVAQGELADAYLDAGQATEASVIAEDLVVRDPSNESHLARYRKALVALGEADPDARIAERVGLGGATDDGEELGADFFDEPAASREPVAPVAAAVAGAGGAGMPALAELSTEGGVPSAPPSAGDGVVELSARGRDLTSLFAEEFAPASAAQSTAAPVDAPPPQPQPARPSAAASPGTGGSMEIDLTSVLGDLQPAAATPQPSAQVQDQVPMPAPTTPRPASGGVSTPGGMPPAPSLDEVFDEFRDATAADKPVEEAAAEKYQLGLSYRKMGKLDEAIGALEMAALSPRYRFNSAVMLGRLYFDKQDPARAVDWLERAAEAPGPSEDDRRALLYHLGLTLERIGATARALAVLMELAADAGEYRDVAQRVERLARVQTGG